MANLYAEWIARFNDDGDVDNNPLVDALRLETAFLISRQRYSPSIRRGGRLVRESLDDFYVVSVLRDAVDGENVDLEVLVKAWKILRGLPQSPRLPCVEYNGGIVSCALRLDHLGPIGALFDVAGQGGEPLNIGIDSARFLALLRSTAYACLTDFAHSHLGPRRVLYGVEAAVPAELVPADVPPVPVPAAVEAVEALANNPSTSCPVCLTTMLEPSTLGCGHSFCIGCLRIIPLRRCPTCRYRYFVADLRVNYQFRDAIAELVQLAPPAADDPPNPAPAPAPAVVAALAPAPAVDAAPEDEGDDSEEEEEEEEEEENDFAGFNPQSSLLALDATSFQALALNNRTENSQWSGQGGSPEILDCINFRTELGEDANPPGDSIQRLSDSQIVTLLRRAGVLAESADIFDKVRDMVSTFVETILRRTYHLRRRVFDEPVDANAAISAMPNGKTLVGFGHSMVRNVWTAPLLAVLRLVHPPRRITPEGLSVVHDLVTDIMMRLLETATKSMSEYSSINWKNGDEEEDGDSDEEEEDASDGLRDYIVINAGPVGADGLPNATNTVKMYIFRDDERYTVGRRTSPTPMRCVVQQDLIVAASLVLGGELAKHATTEITKACIKYGSSIEEGVSMGLSAGLQFVPEHVALLADRERNLLMTAPGAVALTAVMEYVVAEVLELAGKTADAHSPDGYITPRHVMLAVQNDEELAAVFCQCVFRRAGVLPCILPRIQPDFAVEELAFLDRMAAKAMAARSDDMIRDRITPTFIDPRTGLHYAVEPTALNPCNAVPCPVLDVLSQETREERQRMAVAALPAADVERMKQEGFRLRFKESYTNGEFEFPERVEDNEEVDDEEEEGWAEETLEHVHFRRLDEIRAAQADTRFGFEIIPFADFVAEVTKRVYIRTYGIRVTAKAMEAIQTCTEAYVVDLLRDAYEVARTPVLTLADLNRARRRCGAMTW